MSDVIDTTASPRPPECSCRFRFSSHPRLGRLRIRSRSGCAVHDDHSAPPELVAAKDSDPALWAPVYKPAP